MTAKEQGAVMLLARQRRTRLYAAIATRRAATK